MIIYTASIASQHYLLASGFSKSMLYFQRQPATVQKVKRAFRHTPSYGIHHLVGHLIIINNTANAKKNHLLFCTICSSLTQFNIFFFQTGLGLKKKGIC